MFTADELLINENFGNVSLRTLVIRTLTPFGVEDAGRYSIIGDEIELPGNVIPAYALALHGLATNATQYGALPNNYGQVHIEWFVETAGCTRGTSFGGSVPCVNTRHPSNV